MESRKMIATSPAPAGLFHRWIVSAVILLVLGLSMSAHAESAEPVPALMDSLSPDSARYLVRIQRTESPPINVAETLTVTVETYGWPFAACALKIGTNSPYVDIIGIIKGEIIDSCEWEFFRASRVKTENKPRYPKSLWSVIALAKFSPDTLKAVCLGLNREASIMRLIVVSAPNVPIKDSTAAIFFLWEDCRDNTLSDSSGSVLLISQKIFDYYDSELTQDGDAFPTRLGTPEQCINPRLESHPRRKIEFHNGGLDFKLLIPESAPVVSPVKIN